MRAIKSNSGIYTRYTQEKRIYNIFQRKSKAKRIRNTCVSEKITNSPMKRLLSRWVLKLCPFSPSAVNSLIKLNKILHFTVAITMIFVVYNHASMSGSTDISHQSIRKMSAVISFMVKPTTAKARIRKQESNNQCPYITLDIRIRRHKDCETSPILQQNFKRAFYIPEICTFAYLQLP